MTTVLDARPQGEAPDVQAVRSVLSEGLDRQVLEVARAGGTDVLVVNEADDAWTYRGHACRGIEVAG
jgi:hypothetical protein